jgi:hypothetical protein
VSIICARARLSASADREAKPFDSELLDKSHDFTP